VRMNKKTESYNDALLECTREMGKKSSIGRSTCIRGKYIDNCKKSGKCSYDPKHVSRLKKWDTQKWVYLTAFLLDGDMIQCGTMQNSEQGKACRPLYRHGDKGAISIKDMLTDNKWFVVQKHVSPVKKLNRMSNYKDARKNDVKMMWEKGVFYDVQSGERRNFETMLYMPEGEFRKELKKYDKDVAKNFVDLDGCRVMMNFDKCKYDAIIRGDYEGSAGDTFVFDGGKCTSKKDYRQWRTTEKTRTGNEPRHPDTRRRLVCE
jgi:hypothetical protein